MQVDLYERLWMWAATALLAVFVCAIVLAGVTHALHPPSHVETIDPVSVRTETEFASPAILHGPDGVTTVIMRVELYAFVPDVVRVPAGRPVTFRMTSPDVIHGFQIVGTNANVTVVPGYVSQFTTTFPAAGEYLIVCNEYCGLAHHLMRARLVVEDAP